MLFVFQSLSSLGVSTTVRYPNVLTMMYKVTTREQEARIAKFIHL